jgi:hypothetical protein
MTSLCRTRAAQQRFNLATGGLSLKAAERVTTNLWAKRLTYSRSPTLQVNRGPLGSFQRRNKIMKTYTEEAKLIELENNYGPQTYLEYAACPICGQVSYFVIVADDLCDEKYCKHFQASDNGQYIFE